MALTDGLRKPTSCPSCRGSDIRRIMYGLPTTETLERAKRGEVVLGGCSIFDDMPDWRCMSCGHQWFDPTDPVRIEWDQLLMRLEREHYEKLNGNATE